ncbi:MAG: glycosyltransferase [Lachnospiraceae bacterium]
MIPRKIHYCWFGNSPLPEKDQKCIESWKKYCPDYEIVEWNEQNYDINQCIYMKEAYHNRKWGFVPDYARYDIIYREGGIYLDTDVEIIRNIDELLKYEGFMGFESDKYVAAGLGFGAEAGNKVLKEMRDAYHQISFVREDGSLNLKPSPQYTTESLQKMGLRADGSSQQINGMKIFSSEYLAPLCYANNKLKITKNTYSIHWYHASWYGEEERRIMQRVQKVNRIFGVTLGRGVNRIINAIYIIKDDGFKELGCRIKKKVGK